MTIQEAILFVRAHGGMFKRKGSERWLTLTFGLILGFCGEEDGDEFLHPVDAHDILATDWEVRD